MEYFNNNFNKSVDKNEFTISISTVLEMISSPFDQQGVAQNTYNKHYEDEESQYYHKSIDEILDMWAEKGQTSCHYGSLLDSYIGYNLNKEDDDLEIWKLDNNYDYDERLHNHCDAFDNFYKELMKSGEWEFVTRERTVYVKTEKGYIKGRFDALFRNKVSGKFLIVDWKSSGTIDKVANRWTKKLLGPAFMLPELNYYKYTFQLFFYKKALIEGGYLPEGTSFDDVNAVIVNLPDHIIESVNQNFEMHRPAFAYDDELMNKVLEFALNKKSLLLKKQK